MAAVKDYITGIIEAAIVATGAPYTEAAYMTAWAACVAANTLDAQTLLAAAMVAIRKQ